GLPQQERNIAPSYGLDNYFGQSSQFEMMKNVGHPQIFMSYLLLMQMIIGSDSDDLPNAEKSGDNIPFEASSSDDDFYAQSVTKTNIHESFLCIEQGCQFMLTSFNDKHTNMWKVGRYIKEHTCDMGTCRDGHFNLDIEMIAFVLRTDTEKTPRFSIKDYQTTVLKAYGISISKRKEYIGRKCTFEKFYSTWEGSFAKLSRFMEALKHFNPGTIVEWKIEWHVDVIKDVFNYVF
ncbi:hypothetical protein H5410_030408, partial [Solanum commersonii]